jgi:hypothetical protein
VTQDGLSDLALWRRFHVVVTALFGLPMLLVAAVAIGLWYDRAVTRETDSLKIRLRDGAIALSYTLDPEGWLGAPTLERCLPLRGTFGTIAASQGDVASIYMLRATKPGSTELEFMCDWVTAGHGDPATPGDRYDANQADGMLESFTEPRVADGIYVDAWGRTISGYAPVRDAQGAVVGIVGIDIAGSRVDAIEREVKVGAVGLFAFTAILLALVARLAGAALRDPMLKILQATTAITAGRLEARAGLDRHDEFGILARHLDTMAAGLEEREWPPVSRSANTSATPSAGTSRTSSPSGSSAIATRLGWEERRSSSPCCSAICAAPRPSVARSRPPSCSP